MILGQVTLQQEKKILLGDFNFSSQKELKYQKILWQINNNKDFLERRNSYF